MINFTLKLIEYFLVIFFAMLVVRFIPAGEEWVFIMNNLVDSIINLDYNSIYPTSSESPTSPIQKIPSPEDDYFSA